MVPFIRLKINAIRLWPEISDGPAKHPCLGRAEKVIHVGIGKTRATDGHDRFLETRDDQSEGVGDRPVKIENHSTNRWMLRRPRSRHVE
jgi:hypothetical protein